MANHYEILGLNPGAGNAEIKSAFRRLAKLYHPDKNPAGKEHFTKILKAYEILSDPVLKSTYDYRLTNNLQTQHNVKKNSGTKTWTFDEKEMKRRQYYNDHIKKYTKTNAHFAAEPERKPYNEYKYILFATPLAVALFLLIMNMATDPPHITKPRPLFATQDPQPAAMLKNGDAPYSHFFGGARFDSTGNCKLLVKNNTGKDIIICLFSTSGFWRSCFIKNNHSSELSQLPKKSLAVLYSSGSQFSVNTIKNAFGAEGAFTTDAHFYKSENGLRLKELYQLTLQQGLNTNFKEITEEEFFTNAIIHS